MRSCHTINTRFYFVLGLFRWIMFSVIADAQPLITFIIPCMWQTLVHTQDKQWSQMSPIQASGHLHTSCSSPTVHLDLHLSSALLQSISGDSATLHRKLAFLYPFTIYHLCPSKQSSEVWPPNVAFHADHGGQQLLNSVNIWPQHFLNFPTSNLE